MTEDVEQLNVFIEVDLSDQTPHLEPLSFIHSVIQAS